ncbi:endospore germination permease [Alicyclobacillus sp. SO9]|uniref:GerAB/ArcD/ProY family transporter n=1 Tax=Alicyclobacillus sp. SO9 TaxID=2665646 RepID=UPI0018E8AE87|nr:endospore germination permease [Alicyclobacillus sp. SO9]QQE81032.1 endospore germination permease [Alicyclobacillus sp. SO9]
MKTQVSRTQFRYLMLWLIMGTGILTMPLAIANFTVHDGWIASLLFILGTGAAALIVKVFTNYFPSQSLTEALIESFGPWLGRVFGLWLLFWLLNQAALMARQFLVFAGITILPKTPEPLIAGVFFIPIAYAVFSGMEVIARFAQFVTPLSFLVVLFITGLIVPTMHPDMLLPILGDGWSPVFRAAIQPTVAFALQLVTALELVPHLKQPEKAAMDIVWIGIVITLFLAMIEVLIISVLGLTANYLQYPILEVVRGIRIGRFIQRFDTLYVLGIISVIFLKVSLYQYCFTSSLKTFTNAPSLRNLTLGSVAVTGAASLYLWRDSVELSHYMLFVTPAYFGMTLTVLPLGAVLAKQVRNRVRNSIRGYS